MEIVRKKISIRNLVENYEDNGEDGIFGFNKKLDIRPPYQREFVYDSEKRSAVIDTVIKGFPLNTMYWANKENDEFEIIDGQQRTISICQFVEGVFSFNDLYFHNFQDDQKEKFLDYELTVYQCKGTPSERLDWFRVINIAGETLSEQELRNATYSGTWVTDAKRYFCKSGGPAYQLGKEYLSGSANRGKYLETTIKWIKDDSNTISEYMGAMQLNEDASDLWNYYVNVIEWVKKTFTTYRSKMKNVQWGLLYNDFKDKSFNSEEIEEQVKKLFIDDDVSNKSGIYEYVLRGDEKFLNIRAFTEQQKIEMYERQNRKCKIRNLEYDIEDMHADHIIPWSEGGKTNIDNGQMIHKDENRRKSNN